MAVKHLAHYLDEKELLLVYIKPNNRLFQLQSEDLYLVLPQEFLITKI